MSNGKKKDAYKKLGRFIIIVAVLLALCAGGYYMMDQSITAQKAASEQSAAEENARLEAAYKKAKAEEQKKTDDGEINQRPEPAQSGVDVLDLSGYPVENAYQVTASRKELIMGGMLLLNHWHALPADFPEDELLSIHSVDKTVPVSGSGVKMFPAAITALSQMLNAAKNDGLEYYLVDEAYRTMEKQTEYYEKEAAKYNTKYSGDALIEKVRQTTNYPGTSEYQSGFSFRIDRYHKDDAEFNKAKFYTTPHSDWLVEHSWEYGFVFRFPVDGYPNNTMTDKSYKTGESKSLSVYRYVGKANAAIMHELDLCMEEYIEYLMQHTHIALYEDGEIKYEVLRQAGGTTAADVSVEVSHNAESYVISTDNMGGVITAMSY